MECAIKDYFDKSFPTKTKGNGCVKKGVHLKNCGVHKSKLTLLRAWRTLFVEPYTLVICIIELTDFIKELLNCLPGL